MVAKALTATVRFEFQVDLKAVQHRIRRPQEIPTRLRQTLILAHQLKYLLESGKVNSMVKLAKWLKLTHGRVSQIMSLLYLAPAIQEEILCSREERLQVLAENEVRPIASELVWERQRMRWVCLTLHTEASAVEKTKQEDLEV